jgi:hypothetical protein
MGRIALTKKTRFEVFKRDSFTCQYCGCSSPNVVLNVDHISPVSEGGDNNLLNLITACFGCNAGKSDRKLDDSAVVQKQIDQLKEINAKSEQIKMIAEWRRGLRSADDESLSVISEHLSTTWNIVLTDAGKKKFRTSIRKYGLEMVFEALDKSSDAYLDDPNDFESHEKFLNYAHRICYWQEKQKKNPEIADISQICAAAERRWWAVKRPMLFAELHGLYLKEKIPLDDLRELVSSVSGITAFRASVNHYLGGAANG